MLVYIDGFAWQGLHENGLEKSVDIRVGIGIGIVLPLGGQGYVADPLDRGDWD